MFGGQSKSQSPANKGDQTVQFRHRDAQRISNAVHAHETDVSQPNPSRLPRAPGSGPNVDEAFFVGAWVKGGEKQITFSANTQSTATAVNLIRSIPAANGTNGVSLTRQCLVIKRRNPTATPGTYILLNSEC